MEEKENLQDENAQNAQNASKNVTENSDAAGNAGDIVSEGVKNEAVDDAVGDAASGADEPSERNALGKSTQHNSDKKKKTKKARRNKNTKKPDVDTSGMTDDEVYAHIQVEKLIQSRKTKRTITFSVLCVALVFALVVIILAAAPVSMMPRCLQGDDMESVTLYGKSASAATLDFEEEADKDKLDIFKKYLSQSFSQTYLSAIFSGSLGSYDIKEPGTTFSDPASSLRGENYAGTGNYLVRLRFKTPQTLTNQNGSKYDSDSGSQVLWDLQLKFTNAYLVVSKDAGLKDTKIYLMASYPTFTGREQTGTVEKLVVVTVKADTNKLFEAWDQFAA